ncbi:MAG: hypothetical protein ACYC64_04085 [Armatimonadota bacterium]
MSRKRFSKPNMVLVVFLTLAMSGLLTEPVWARLFGVQTQIQYNFAELKKRGKQPVGDGRLSTSYNLTLRRPFLATSNLVSDLTINTAESGDAGASQTSKNWTLNMYSDRSKYMLVGRVSHSNYGASSTGDAASSTGYSTDYNASLFLRQPAYPVVNLQYLRNTSSSSYAGSTGSYTSSSWLMSSYYDMAPLRFSYDRTQQAFVYSGSPGTQMNTQRWAATLNQTLMSGLTLSGELSRYGTAIGYVGGNTATNTNRRVLRLTATPTRAIVADIDITSQSVQQDVADFSRTNSDNTFSWDVRSEIMPGLSLDYVDQRQSQLGSDMVGTSGSTSRNRNLSVSARLSEQTVLTIGGTRSDYDVDTADSDSRVDSIQSAIQTSLTPTTDFSLNYGKSKSITGLGDLYDSSFAGLSIRDRTSATLSVGATYRRTNVLSVSGTDSSAYSQRGDVVDMDMLWQPSYSMGVNLRLSYQNNQGSNASKVLAPSANFRWQVDSSTNLMVNYAFQRYNQLDPLTQLLYGQDTRGLSMRLTHAFRNNSSLDLSYDFQGSSIGDQEWSRHLRMYITTNL